MKKAQILALIEEYTKQRYFFRPDNIRVTLLKQYLEQPSYFLLQHISYNRFLYFIETTTPHLASVLFNDEYFASEVNSVSLFRKFRAQSLKQSSRPAHRPGRHFEMFIPNDQIKELWNKLQEGQATKVDLISVKKDIGSHWMSALFQILTLHEKNKLSPGLVYLLIFHPYSRHVNNMAFPDKDANYSLCGDLFAFLASEGVLIDSASNGLRTDLITNMWGSFYNDHSIEQWYYITSTLKKFSSLNSTVFEKICEKASLEFISHLYSIISTIEKNNCLSSDNLALLLDYPSRLLSLSDAVTTLADANLLDDANFKQLIRVFSIAIKKPGLHFQDNLKENLSLFAFSNMPSRLLTKKSFDAICCLYLNYDEYNDIHGAIREMATTLDIAYLAGARMGFFNEAKSNLPIKLQKMIVPSITHSGFSQLFKVNTKVSKTGKKFIDATMNTFRPPGRS